MGELLQKTEQPKLTKTQIKLKKRKEENVKIKELMYDISAHPLVKEFKDKKFGKFITNKEGKVQKKHKRNVRILNRINRARLYLISQIMKEFKVNSSIANDGINF